MRRGRGEMEQGEKRQREREARRDTSSGLGPHGGDVSLACSFCSSDLGSVVTSSRDPS